MHGSLTDAASCLFTLPLLLKDYHCCSKWQEFYLFGCLLQLMVFMTPFWIVKFKKTSEFLGQFAFLIQVCPLLCHLLLGWKAEVMDGWYEKPYCDHVGKTGQCLELTSPIAYICLMREKNKVLVHLSYSLIEFSVRCGQMWFILYTEMMGGD